MQIQNEHIEQIPNSFRTNEINVDKLFTRENLKKIDEKFSIYRFDFENEDTYYSPFIDKIYENIKFAKATIHAKNVKGKGHFYVLFEKTEENEFEIIDQLKEIAKGELKRNQIKIKETKEKYQNDLDIMQSRHLAQLLLNSLAHKNKDSFNNMTGRLYWLVKTKNASKKDIKLEKPAVQQQVALEIKIDQDLLLELNVRTFTNIEYVEKYNLIKGSVKKRAQYIISNDEVRTMQPHFGNSKNKDIFIIAQFENTRSTIPFFNFSTGNVESFKESKSGVLDELLKQAKSHLSDYMTIKFCERPFTESIDEKSNANKDTRVMDFFKQKQINIDVAESLKENKEIEDLSKKIKEVLKKDKQYECQNVNISPCKIDDINIRIIREEKYYQDEKNKIKDEHFNKSNKKNKEQYVVQHITDKFKLDKNNKKVNYLLTEAFIKNDLKQKKISIIDWKFGKWTFLHKEKKEIGTLDGEEKKYIITFYLMTVGEDGELDFEVCKGHDLFSSQLHKEYQEKYMEEDESNKYKTGNIEGLIISDEGDINIIYRTPIITLQEIEEIALEFERGSEDTEIEVQNLIRMFSNFIMQQKTDEYKEVLKDICGDIKEFGKTITKARLNGLFEKHLIASELVKDKNGINKSSLKRKFNTFYRDNSFTYLGIEDILHPRIIKQEINKSKIGIQYHEDKKKKRQYYFAGEYSDKIKSSFSTATHIRIIKPVRKLNGDKSKILFNKLLPTMDVDFVKKGNPTVIPFPFKYLREWIKMNSLD